MAVVRSRTLRTVLMVLGWLWVGIAFIGIFVPILPSTGPILLAAFLFSKSSERFDRWIVENRYFGSIVRDWRSGAGFTVRAKVIAVSAIMLSFGISTFIALRSTHIYFRAGMWALAFAVAAYVVTRPTKRTTPATQRTAA
ncbi:MAG: YbaN family protein [Actinomycetia bacterium]|nr:YbaN family protein [Actinomycetes bacterium]